MTGKDPAGDVHAKGLTKAELAAVDIVSVKVTGAGDFGVFVTVTFRGDFQKAMGHGGLAKAATALVLSPKKGAGLSAGLVTQGPGIGALYRHTASTDVGAFRSGRTLTFFILGPGFDNVASVGVETVVKAGNLTAARTSSGNTPPIMGPRTWDKFLSLHPIDKHVQITDPSGLSCPELQDLLRSIDEDFADPGFSLVVSIEVRQALAKFRDTVKSLFAKCAPPAAPAVSAVFAWSFFDPQEVAGAGHFTGPATTFNGIKVVLPSNFNITNHLCPGQLPHATITGNVIVCDGGTLSTGQNFTLNLQTSPFPTTGMGGQLFGETPGGPLGPFTITGP